MTDAPVIIRYEEKGADRVKRSFRDIRKGANDAGKATDRLGNAIKAIFGAAAIRKVIQYSDTFKQLAGRLQIVSTGFESVAQTQERLFQVAQKTRQPLEGITSFYARLNQFIPEAERNQYNLLRVTQSVSAALAITGETGASATSAMIQFSQAIGTNFESAGQEIRSLQEQAPRLTKALVDALGGGVKSLKQLQEEGKLTRESVLVALGDMGGAAGELAAELEQIPLTVGQAFQRLDNSFLRFIGLSDEITSSTEGLAQGISKLAEGIDYLAGNTAFMESAMIALGVAFALAFPQITAFAVVLASVGAAAKFVYDEFPIVSEAVHSVGQAFADVESPIADLQATFITVVGSFVKFGATIGSVAESIYAAFKSPFEKIGRLFNAFKADLAEFIANPFGDSDGFARVQAELTEGFAQGFKRAYMEARKEGEKFNEFIDEEMARRISELDDKSEKAAKQIAKIGKAPNKPQFRALSKDAQDFKDELEDLASKIQRDVLAIGLDPMEEKLLDLEILLSNNSEAFKELGDSGQEMAEKIREGIKQVGNGEKIESEIREPFKNALEDVQGAFSETFENIFSGGLDSFSDLADAVKGIFIKLAAQVATLLVFKPELLSSGGGIGSVIGNIFSGGASGSGGGIPSIPGTSFLTGGGGSGFSVAGGALPGSGASLGSLFGGAGVGLGIASLIGNGSIESQIGGGLGGIAGSFLGGTAIGGSIAGGATTSLVGAGLSTGLASAIGGLVLPGIGAIAGTLIGGLFGSEPPDEISGFAGRLGTRGLKSSGLGSKTVGTEGGAALRDAADSFFTAITDRLQVNFDNLRIGGSFSKKQGDSLVLGAYENEALAKTLGSQRFTFNRDDPESLQKAFAELTVAMLKQVDVNDNLAIALENIETAGRSAEEILNDLEFAANFDKLGESPEVIGRLEIAMLELDARFAEMADTASRLGLDVDRVTEALGKAKDAFKNQVQGELIDGILSNINPAIVQLKAETERYKAVLKDAQKIGLDTANIELDHKLRVAKINQQIVQNEEQRLSVLIGQANESQRLADSFGQVVSSLDAAVNGLRIGSLSVLSPLDKVNEARSQFQSTAALAAGGDLEAARRLPQIGQDFLSVAREYFGSSSGFVDAFNLVETGLVDARDVAEEQRAIQQNIANQAQQQVALLNQGFKQTKESNQQLLDLQREGIKRATDYYQKDENYNKALIEALRRIQVQ